MTTTLIISLLLLGLALFILLWFLSTLFNASTLEWRTFKLRTSIKRRVEHLQKASKLQNQGKLPEALTEIKNSLILDDGPWSHSFIEDISNHHLNALNQLVLMSEKLGQQISNLPIAEGLFLTRTELLKSFSDASRAVEAVKKKLKERGTEQQNWAYAEVTKKLDELKDKLATNKRTINYKYDEIAKKLTRSTSSSADFTYH